MATAFLIKDKFRDILSSGTHIDGTARIQIVENNSPIDKLFSKLEPLGIEILANSSLNVSGDPTCFDLVDGLMVCSRTKLCYLLTDIGLLKKT